MLCSVSTLLHLRCTLSPFSNFPQSPPQLASADTPKRGRTRRAIRYSVRTSSNLRNAESVICSRSSGTRTHDLLRVEELFLPLNYASKSGPPCDPVGEEGLEPSVTCTQSTRHSR